MHQLSEEALKFCKCSKPISRALAFVLGCSDNSINRYIRENSDVLTKYAVLEVLAHVTAIPMWELVIIKPGTYKFTGTLMPFSKRNHKINRKV
jgi:hypothetical protein